jgi:hypothetical protein
MAIAGADPVPSGKCKFYARCAGGRCGVSRYGRVGRVGRVGRLGRLGYTPGKVRAVWAAVLAWQDRLTPKGAGFPGVSL